MKYLILLLILGICYGCASVSKECEILGHYNNWHVDTYSKEPGISIMGIGGATPNKLDQFHLYYRAEHELTVDEVRPLIVRFVEGMVEKVNREGMNPECYNNFPINHNNVEITISFSRRTPPYVTLVYNANDLIYYDGFDKEKGKYFSLHVETYEEALEHLRNRASSPCRM